MWEPLLHQLLRYVQVHQLFPCLRCGRILNNPYMLCNRDSSNLLPDLLRQQGHVQELLQALLRILYKFVLLYKLLLRLLYVQVHQLFPCLRCGRILNNPYMLCNRDSSNLLPDLLRQQGHVQELLQALLRILYKFVLLYKLLLRLLYAREHQLLFVQQELHHILNNAYLQ